MSEPYPFSAIVGMDLAKTSMLLHAVNPGLGGVLLSGHRGCAKTTLARAFGDLLDGCPVCEVPLGASEDRLLGSVDVSAVLERNEWSHQPGLLEQANGGVLYVDEVNLLPDDLSDQLLDASATGGYQLEREGMSRRIESRFILVGTMNPEEGKLRPQLADRFAHSVSIATEGGAEERTQIIEQRIRFEADPVQFRESCAKEMGDLRERIAEAREGLASVELSREMMAEIGERAESLGLEGMRGGLAVAKTAMAAAAWQGSSEVTREDLDLAWLLCLGQQPNDNHEPPPPEKPDQGKGEEKSEGTRSFVSLQPRGANEDAMVQTAGEDEIDSSLASWLSRPSAGVPLRKSSPSVNAGLIHWRETVLGWLKEARRERVRRFRLRRTRHLWVFLDASRSSGANAFLEKGLTLLSQALNPVAFQSLRVHVLKLSHGQLTWLGQDMVVGDAGKVLKEPMEAAGESSLSEALVELLRDVRRRGAGPSDSVVVFSDGIATARDEAAVTAVKEKMSRSLFRLSRLGPELRWFAPRSRRGFLHPVDTLGVGGICGANSI
ncbi:MAG: AAA family ATPase [Verrucomicrobiota bacterium]